MRMGNMGPQECRTNAADQSHISPLSLGRKLRNGAAPRAGEARHDADRTRRYLALPLGTGDEVLTVPDPHDSWIRLTLSTRGDAGSLAVGGRLCEYRPSVRSITAGARCDAAEVRSGP